MTQVKKERKMCKENQKKKHNKAISVVLIISMLFTMTFVSFAEDGIGETQSQPIENQNEGISENSEENDNKENLDNEENQESVENPGENLEENKNDSKGNLQKSEEEAKTPEENKEHKKDPNNIFDGFDFGKINIEKIGEILNPENQNQDGSEENSENHQDETQNNEESSNQNSDSGETQGQNKDEEQDNKDSESLFDNIGNLFDKIKDYVKVDENDKIIEEIRDEINLEEINMTVQCDELFFTVIGKAPEGTIMKVEKLNENFEEQITEKLEENKRFNQLAAFDIKLIKPDGSQYQPIDFGGKVKISVVGLAGNVFRIENEEVTDMQAEFSDEETEFETEHFTTYVIGGVTHTSEKTGYWLGMQYNLYDTDDDGAAEYFVLTGVQNQERKDIELINATLNQYGTVPIPDDSNIRTCIVDAKVYPKNLFYKSKFKKIIFGDHFGILKESDFSRMFCKCGAKEIILSSKFKEYKPKNLYVMFELCANLTSLDIKNLNSSMTTDFRYFISQTKLKNLDLSNLDTRRAINLEGFLYNNRELESVKFGPKFIGKNVENFREAFRYCVKLKKLDLSSFVLAKTPLDLTYPFGGLLALEEIKTFPVSEDRPESPNGTHNGLVFAHPMYDEDGEQYSNMPYFHNKSITLYKTPQPIKKKYVIDGTEYTSVEKGKWLGMDYDLFSVESEKDYMLLTGTQTQSNTSPDSFRTQFPTVKHIIVDAELTNLERLFEENSAKSVKFTNDNFRIKSTVNSFRCMFKNSKISNINFGNNFDTSNIKDMSYMFNNTSISNSYGGD